MINDSIFNIIILMESSGMLVVIYAKILHHSFIPTIYENFKSNVFLSSANENLRTLSN